jgi:hypothetical protein
MAATKSRWMAFFLLQEPLGRPNTGRRQVHHFASVFHFEARKMQQASWDST